MAPNPAIPSWGPPLGPDALPGLSLTGPGHRPYNALSGLVGDAHRAALVGGAHPTILG